MLASTRYQSRVKSRFLITPNSHHHHLLPKSQSTTTFHFHHSPTTAISHLRLSDKWHRRTSTPPWSFFAHCALWSNTKSISKPLLYLNFSSLLSSGAPQTIWPRDVVTAWILFLSLELEKVKVMVSGVKTLLQSILLLIERGQNDAIMSGGMDKMPK